MRMNFKPVQDGLSVGVGLFTSGGIGLAGTAAKKLLIRQDDGFAKRFMVGLVATLATGGTGFVPYFVASPGLDAKADVQAARANAADQRF